MMWFEEREYAAQADQDMLMPATSVEDPRTYDPTQGKGTEAWQAAVKRQAELNARLGLETNARFRRN